MKFTDVFIKRPVLAMVLALFVLLLGVRSLTGIGVREFPKITKTTITVSTAYPGASAETIQGFITQPMSQAIASADGIEYLTSNTYQGTSTVTANIRLNYNPTEALTDVTAKVNQVRNQLPRESQAPVITKTTGERTAIMYLAFYSKTLGEPQITDYLNRVVVPKLQSVPGVAQAQVLGTSFAMRIWLDPQRLAAHHISPQQVATAIQNNNFIAAVGSTKAPYVTVNVNAKTNLSSAKAFDNMVVSRQDGSLIRVRDLGHAELGSESYDSAFLFDGKPSVGIAINPAPSANPLTVADGIKKIFPSLQNQFPPGLSGTIAFDVSEFIHSSITDVIWTLIEAGLIVMLVIFLFLGAIRSAIIPAVTMPLSLIGTVFVMLILGYSINLLTLLALVLAVGLVVDDAIIVVENIYRHLEEGIPIFKAALTGAREIGSSIVAMSITLAAVFAPIGFQSGLTGALFTQFAFTLAAAVIISGFLALTLSPMMCSKILRPPEQAGRFAVWVNDRFESFKNGYFKLLHAALNIRPVILLVAVVVLVSIPFLYTWSASELAPNEDQGAVFLFGLTPPTATIDYDKLYAKEINQIFKKVPQRENSFVIAGFHGTNVLGLLILKPWGKRDKSAMQIKNEVTASAKQQIAGFQTFVGLPPSLPGSGGGANVQFVLSSTAGYPELHKAAEQIVRKAQGSGLFFFVDQGLKFDQPEYQITVDRSKAQSLGLSMADIGSAMGTLLGGGYVNRFVASGYAYKVIPLVLRKYRLDKSDLENYRIQTPSGAMIPLSEVVNIKQTTVPSSLTQFDQLNSTTISGALKPGVSLGDALHYLQQQAKGLSKGYFVNYEGQSRQYIQSGSALLVTFIFAIIVIYLILAALFETFRDPFIILVSVPMGICGALFFIYWGADTVNIYTQVGLLTLVGLLSKHSIIIVRFANDIQREEGLSIRDAVEKASAIRLRPVLMTTAAMVFGVVPLVFATGAGAAARFSIGLVVSTGMLIGTIFTLFVVPMVYTYVAARHKPIHDDEEEGEEERKPV